MEIKRLLPALSTLLLSGTLVLADDWLVGDPDGEDSIVETWSDPWLTESDSDPFGLTDPTGEADETPDRFRLYNERGRQTGRAERNRLSEDGYTLYDDRGRRTGRVDEDALREGDFSVYDDRGRRVREIRRNPLVDDQYDVYDDRGRRIGRIRENPIIDGSYDIYDERGRRVGRAEGD